MKRYWLRTKKSAFKNHLRRGLFFLTVSSYMPSEMNRRKCKEIRTNQMSFRITVFRSKMDLNVNWSKKFDLTIWQEVTSIEYHLSTTNLNTLLLINSLPCFREHFILAVAFQLNTHFPCKQNQ